MSLSLTTPLFTTTTTTFIFFLLFQEASSATPIIPINATCHNTFGTIPVKYLFGIDYGCGHVAFSSTFSFLFLSTNVNFVSKETQSTIFPFFPFLYHSTRLMSPFSRYIKCIFDTLQSSTGTYTITLVDYPTNTLIVTNPFMSNCSEMQNSGSLSLDKVTPFTLENENIFVLLGCSTTSPLFDSTQDFCDTGSGSRVCRGLYSCKEVMGIGLPQNAPISTCCVYDYPTGLGLGYSLDLPRLQCSSYASVYEFGDEGDPMKWKFGVLLLYNDSYHSDSCKDCEGGGGVCGFDGLDESFACVCKNRVNTTTNCFGQGYAWSGTRGQKIPTMLTIGGTQMDVNSLTLPGFMDYAFVVAKSLKYFSVPLFLIS